VNRSRIRALEAPLQPILKFRKMRVRNYTRSISYGALPQGSRRHDQMPVTASPFLSANAGNRLPSRFEAFRRIASIPSIHKTTDKWDQCFDDCISDHLSASLHTPDFGTQTSSSDRSIYTNTLAQEATRQSPYRRVPASPRKIETPVSVRADSFEPKAGQRRRRALT
jgi:hypothetical protein